MKYLLILVTCLISLGHSRMFEATAVGRGFNLETAQENATNNAIKLLFKLALSDKDTSIVYVLGGKGNGFITKSSDIKQYEEVQEVTKEDGKWKITVKVKWNNF